MNEPTYPPGLSVIVPCHNEQDAIADVLDTLDRIVKAMPVAAEIIVVDDGSTDDTAQRVDTGRFGLLRLPLNLGYGAALVAGARRARYDSIVITDGDGTYPNEQIPELYRLLCKEDHDMVVGARTGARVHIPLVRRPAKWLITCLANYLTGCRIPDLNSGLRIVRRSVWQRYERYFPKGFSLTTTITLATLVNGHRVHFHPIDYHPRVGSSKIRPIKDTINFISLILRTVLYFDPMKVFVPVSLVLIGMGLLIGTVSLVLMKIWHIGLFMDVTTVVFVLTGIQMIAIGGLADLISKRLP